LKLPDTQKNTWNTRTSICAAVADRLPNFFLVLDGAHKDRVVPLLAEHFSRVGLDEEFGVELRQAEICGERTLRLITEVSVLKSEIFH
jgi:hypothetical protein